jgi:hypothetical protein
MMMIRYQNLYIKNEDVEVVVLEMQLRVMVVKAEVF